MTKPDDKPTVIRKISLAYFKNKKLLAVREHDEDVFYSVGGRVEADESDIDCLIREVREEINVDLVKNSIKFLHEFEYPQAKETDATLNIKLYQADIIGTPRIGAEIAEIEYIDSRTDPKKLTPMGNMKMMPWLKEHGYIN